MSESPLEDELSKTVNRNYSYISISGGVTSLRGGTTTKVGLKLRLYANNSILGEERVGDGKYLS